MDVEQPRLYIREWKRNKPYLPKSTSLPVLRLAPQNRVIFACKKCGFSNFLVPMCLWCCWSSAEARDEFEANARRSFRKKSRSAPRPFSKPGWYSSTNSRKVGYLGPGKRRHSIYHINDKTQTSATISTSSTPVFSPHCNCTVQPTPLRLSNINRKNGVREGRISEPRAAYGSRSQGLSPESGIDDCGTGSIENNNGPTRVTFQPPRPFVPLNHPQPGDSDKNASGGFLPSSSPDLPTFHRVQPCFQLFPKRSSPTLRFPARTLLATLIPSRGSGGPPKEYATDNFRVICNGKKESTSKSSFRTMLVDRPTTDTRCDTTTASYIVKSPWTVATNAMTTMCEGQATPGSDCDIYNCHDSKPMDVEDATTNQSNQAPTSLINQTETCTTTGRRSGSDLDATTEMTLTKVDKRNAHIHGTLLQSSTCPDTPIASGNRASRTPVMTEVASQSQSPTRILKRKKRLSLADLSNTNPRNLIPPTPPIPLSPPPLQTSSSLQFSPTHAFVTTPPSSPSQSRPVVEKFSPSIVLSAPASTTPVLVHSSKPIPPLITKPSQTLPRIGTPKRPYYSTIRANMNAKAASSTSPMSTPPASPSSSTFPSAYCDSQSPTPGSPDRAPHLGASVTQRPVGNSTTEAVANSPTLRTPPQTPIIQTVPPLPPIVSNPVPMPIPVRMHMRPSSPVRSILSVLDPDQDDEEDDDSEYSHYGMNASRFGRVLREKGSGNMKEKGKARGDQSGGGYHFPLSLSLSLGKKRGRTTVATTNQKLDKEDVQSSRTLSPSRSYAGLGGMGMGRGYSMSGEVEMRMALAERGLNANGGSASGLEPAFKFREIQRPSYDAEIQVSRSKSAGKLIKMRSTIGLSTTSLTTSPPRSPSSLKIGSKLKEMSANFLGKFQGGNSSRL